MLILTPLGETSGFASSQQHNIYSNIS